MDPKRRFFLRAAIPSTRAGGPAAPPRPPWAVRPDAQFTALCTRCGDCVGACPRTLLSVGDGGFPQLSMARQGCDECGACRTACRSGAIAAPADPRPAFTWRVAVGAQCLALRQVECRVCAEACDARALRFRPAPGGVWQLQIDAAACTGCGECVAPCPVGAITLREPVAASA